MLNDVSVLELVRNLKGHSPWGVRLGVGSFLTMEFGKPEANGSGSAVHGEWHLWFYMCSWRIENEDKVIAGSEDERSRIETVLENLALGSIEKIDLVRPSLDLAMQFSIGTKALTFSTSSAGNERQWMLFTPDGHCLTVYGDGSFEYSRKDEPRPRVGE
jgi:hypothetical protein